MDMVKFQDKEFQKKVIDELSEVAYKRIEEGGLTYCEIMSALIHDVQDWLIYYDRCQRQGKS
jgi:hypothetical protein